MTHKARYMHARMNAVWLGLLLVGLAAGCRSTRKAGLDPEAYDSTIKVACVGDSITYGAGVEGRETNNYPFVLGRLLGDRFETRNFGVSGATLLRRGDHPYWQTAEFAALKAYGPQVVVVKLGTNDSKPQNWQYQQEFSRDYRELIQSLRALPSHPRVWICLPVPAYASQWGIRPEIIADQVIPRMQQVAHEMRVPVIDLHEALSERPDLFPDKIHPNAAGATLMAQTVRDALVAR